MVVIHLVYDLAELYGILPREYSPAFRFLKNWGGTAFLVLSGICATLSRRALRRGLLVFGCGMLVTAVTCAVSPELAIRFGVLHCLGSCMILWHTLKRLPSSILAAAALILIPAGFAFAKLRVANPWLFPLGLTTSEFTSADFFPLLPNLGFFLLGAVLGRRFYEERRSLLPRANTQNPAIRFLLLCGRHSLVIYLLHQPVLMLSIELFA